MNSPFLASAMLRMEGCQTDSFKPLSSGPDGGANRRNWLTGPDGVMVSCWRGVMELVARRGA